MSRLCTSAAAASASFHASGAAAGRRRLPQRRGCERASLTSRSTCSPASRAVPRSGASSGSASAMRQRSPSRRTPMWASCRLPSVPQSRVVNARRAAAASGAPVSSICDERAAA
jgi:hypothetical protein